MTAAEAVTASGLTLVELASKCGCTSRAIREATKGNGVPFVRRRLAKVLHRTEAELFGTEPVEVPIITDNRWSKLGDDNE